MTEKSTGRILHQQMKTVLYLLALSLVHSSCAETQDSGQLAGSYEAPEVPKGAKIKLDESDLPPNTRELRFGVTPYLGTERTKRGFLPITQYLSRVLGIPVKLVIADSYKQLIDKVVSKEVDFASLSPISYVLAKERAPYLQILVQEIAGGATSFSSYFIVRSKQNAQTVSALKGKRIAFVDLSSTSGFVIPYAWLLENGLRPQRDFVPCLAGDHPKAIQALIDGRVDLAATGSGMLRSAAKGPTGDTRAVRIVAKAGRIPFDPVCARGEISKAGAQKIAYAFMALNVRTSEGRKTLSNSPRISGWIPAIDTQYDAIRRELSRVRMHRQKSPDLKPIPKCNDESL